MSTIATARAQREVRKAQRNLDSARRDLRFARRLLSVAVIADLGLIALWAFTIHWGVASIGVRDLGGMVFAAITGLVVLTVILVVASCLAGLLFSDRNGDLEKATWSYEDAILSSGGLS